MAALQLDVGGSSTSAANISSGGNAGIQFAPKGISVATIAVVVGALAIGAYIMLSKKKGK